MVMCVYRPDPELFRAAVASILAQSMRDFEFIIAEAPSERSARVILSEFDDDRIVLLENCPKGIPRQANEGIARARGPYIARMDADDIALPDRLEVQSRFLDEHQEVDVVGSDLEIIDAAGQLIGYRHYPSDSEQIRRALRRSNVIAQPTVMARKASLVAAGCYDPTVAIASDYDLWSRILSRGGTLRNLSTPVLRYRLHPGAVKANRLRETLRTSIAVKRKYFASELSLLDWTRLLAEWFALLLPTFVVYKLFAATALERPVAPESGRRELRNSLVLAAGNVTAALLSLFYMSWVGRTLGPEGSADYYAAVFLVFVFVTLMTPMATAVTREAAVATARRQFALVAEIHWMGLRRTVRFALIGAVIVGLLLWPLVSVMKFSGVAVPLLAFSVAFAFALVSISRGVMRGGQKYAAHSFNMVLEAATRLALGITLVSLLGGALVALVAYIVATLIAHAVLLVHTEARRGSQQAAGHAPFASILLPLLVIASADSVFQNFDVFFVKARFAGDSAGVYGAVATLTRVLGVAATPVWALALPHFTHQVALGRSPARALVRLCAVFIGFASVPLLVMALWPEQLMSLLFGDEFRRGGGLVLLHGLSLLPTYLSLFVAQAFVASERLRFSWLYGFAALLYIAVLAFVPAELTSLLWWLVSIKTSVFLALVVLWLLSMRRTGVPAQAMN